DYENSTKPVWQNHEHTDDTGAGDSLAVVFMNCSTTPPPPFHLASRPRLSEERPHDLIVPVNAISMGARPNVRTWQRGYPANRQNRYCDHRRHRPVRRIHQSRGRVTSPETVHSVLPATVHLVCQKCPAVSLRYSALPVRRTLSVGHIYSA